MGMKFGLWFEPEMTNMESELYKEHPDWILSTPGGQCHMEETSLYLIFQERKWFRRFYEQMGKSTF